MINRNFDDLRLKQAVLLFNNALAYLEAQRIESIEIVEVVKQGTYVHFLNKYDWLIQAYLRRMLNLGRNYANLINEEEGLAASIMGRSIIETLSHFHSLLNNCRTLIEKGRFAKAYHLIASYLLYGGHDFLSEKIKIQKLHIAASLRAADKTHLGIQSDYDWLCDFVHPNSQGVILFTSEDYINSKINFFDKPKSFNSLPPIEGVFWFTTFEQEWKNAIGFRSWVAENWKTIPADEIREQFKA